MVELSIILPVYNEKGVIDNIYPRIVDIFSKWEIAKELLIIDDGSDEVLSLDLLVPWARIIRHSVNMGNGAAIKTGIRNAKGEKCVIMDADGQHLPEDAIKLVEKLDQYVLVVGARDFKTTGTFHRNLANQIYSKLASYTSGAQIPDLTSGIRAFRREEVLQIIHLFPNRFSCPTTMTLGLIYLGYQVGFQRINVMKRDGKSKIRIFSDGTRFLLVILKISTLFSPLKIFFPLSLSLFLLGLINYFSVLIFWHRFSLWSVVLLTNAITIFMIGLVAEEISSLKLKKDK